MMNENPNDVEYKLLKIYKRILSGSYYWAFANYAMGVTTVFHSD